MSSEAKRVGSLECPVDTCNQKCNLKTLNNGNFFITLPIKEQLKFLLENTEDMKDLLSYRWKRNYDSDIISDVFDGSVYQKLASGNNFLSEEWNISLTFNTDGANVFKSTKNTLWPVFFRINELPPNVRFNQNFNLLGALWFGSKEPDMSLYLAPFVKEMEDLYNEGFVWEPSPGELIRTKAILLLGVFDSVAKPKVQSHHQFNGYSGCGYCYHPGVPSNHAKFLMNRDASLHDDLSVTYTVTKFDQIEKRDKTLPVVDRKDSEIRNDMTEVENIKEASRRQNLDEIHVRGVKGFSALFPLIFFDLVFGFAIDYMHGILLGSCRTVTNLWLDKDSYFYIGDRAVRGMERRLKTITPPTCISRRPRPLSDRIHWKANEWRSWLLFYSIPCSIGNVPGQYLRHHSLLVTACSILLKDKITKAELAKASWYLVLYVSDVQQIYGKPLMGYNFHLLLHIGKVVSLHGPIWHYSTFSFESANGFLIRLVKGTKGVVAQIAEKYSISRLINRTLSFYRVSARVLNYCEDLLTYRVAAVSMKIKSVTLIGATRHVPLSVAEREAFAGAAIAAQVFSYGRFIKGGVMYHSKCYARKGEKSDDSAVQLQNGSYGVIQRIFIADGQPPLFQRSVQVLLKSIRTVPSSQVESYYHKDGARASHIKRCFPLVFGELYFINAEEIACKVLLIRCDTDTFVSNFPNMYEKD